jgi:hypothetical protein
MTTRRTILAALAGSAMLSSAALVHAATDTTGQDQMPKMHRWQPPSPETMQHLLDGRIAMIKTALQLTPDQEKLWGPVEQVMRDNAAARAKAMADRHNTQGDQGKMDPVARLEAMSKMSAERASNSQKLADALKPLYATLTDEQKAVAMLILEPAGGHRHGPGGGRMMRG